MKTPTPMDVEEFFTHVYDPNKAHEYYMRNRKLKGRKPGVAELVTVKKPAVADLVSVDPRTGKTKDQIHKDARAKQRAELSQAIKTLEGKLAKLKLLIRKKTAEQDSAERKSLGKKERAAKESAKPDTAAEKAKASRDAEKYRDKHKQELKTKAKAKSASTGGGSSTSSNGESNHLSSQIVHLESLATKVSGKLAVAKKKLAAL